MLAYALRRLFSYPDIVGDYYHKFFIIQVAPGGPVEQAIAQLEGHSSGIMELFWRWNEVDSSQSDDRFWTGEQEA